MTLADMCIEPSKPWEYCPREVFRRVVKILKDEFDLVVYVGIEIEFYLLKSVIRYTRKLGKVKYEIVLGYTEASTAIISLIYACEVIKSVSRQLGMMATFVPKLATQNDGAS
ncbi:hypothetical protein BC332_13704 [Capsicum chinense]|nr:hypothetical protein BC332_13704 [Capsicum chinense]